MKALELENRKQHRDNKLLRKANAYSAMAKRAYACPVDIRDVYRLLPPDAHIQHSKV